MGNLDELEKKYKQEAEQLSFTPSPRVWNNVSAEINGGKLIRGGRFLKTGAVLTCLLLAGGAAIYVATTQKSPDIKHTIVPVSVPETKTVTATPQTAQSATETPVTAAPALTATPVTANATLKKESKTVHTNSPLKERKEGENKWSESMSGADMYYRTWQFKTISKDSLEKMGNDGHVKKQEDPKEQRDTPSTLPKE
jgi:hypothetical protein